jgi:hypothetical protein
MKVKELKTMIGTAGAIVAIVAGRKKFNPSSYTCSFQIS